MDLKEHFVITISRQVGSGGHTVGQILADKLGVRYCDKHLANALRAKFGLSTSAIEKMKGEKRSWLSDILKKVAPVPSAKMLDLNPKYTQGFRAEVTSDEIFKAESEILVELSHLESCVIAGRSGFFVLKDHPNRLDVFITASMQSRIQRVIKKQNLTEESARILINDIDQARDNYIKRYAGVSRYDLRNYQLVINTDGQSEEEVAQLILDYIKA